MGARKQTVVPGLSVSRAPVGTNRRHGWEATYAGSLSPCRAMTRRGAIRKARRQYKAENFHGRSGEIDLPFGVRDTPPAPF